MIQAEQSSSRIAYVIKCFPRLSETFILHEVLELERQGVPLVIFSLLEPSGQKNRAIQDVQSPVTYLPQRNFRGFLQLLGAARRRFYKAPIAFIVISVVALFRSLRPFKVLDILYAAYLSDLLEQAGVTHIHAHYANKPATVALLAHQFTGIPFSFTAHAKDIYLSSKKSLVYKMRKARMVVTCTDYNKQHLASLLDPDDQVTIHRVYHGLNLRIFPDNPSNPGLQNPTILSVARLVEKKGLPFLLQACRQLKDQGYVFRCCIIGEGPLRPKLERQINDLALNDCVELCGAMSHERVIEMYRQAALLVLPSVVAENGDRDGIPNVLAEAMYMRVPVISTPVSGIPELLTSEVNGLLVPERDSSALADAMSRLLNDGSLRARLSEEGRRTVAEHFDMAANARFLTNLFLHHGLEAGEPDSSGQLMVETENLMATFPYGNGNDASQ